MKYKVLVLSVHPAPYRDPFLNKLSLLDDFSIVVYNYSTYDKGHSFWNLNNPIYISENLKYKISFLNHFFHLGIFKVLFTKFDYIIIPGWGHLNSTISIIFCVLTNKKFIFLSDNVKKKKNNFLITYIQKIIIKKASFIWVPGLAGKKFYSNEFSVSKQKILKGAYALDASYLYSIYQKFQFSILDRKTSLGIDHQFRVFLMVANFIPSRRYDVLFKSFAKFNSINKNTFLLVIGDGPTKDYVINLASSLFFNNYIIKINIPFYELLSYYALADVYIHSGSEPYSTAVSIASITGKPIVSSYEVGACMDFLIDDFTGIVVKDPLSEQDWISSFSNILLSDFNLMENNHLQLSARFDLDLLVKEFSDKIKI